MDEHEVTRIVREEVDRAVAATEATQAERAYLEQRLAAAEGLRLTVITQEQALRSALEELPTLRQRAARLSTDLAESRSEARDLRRELALTSRRLDDVHASTTFAVAQRIVAILQWLRHPLSAARRLLRDEEAKATGAASSQGLPATAGTDGPPMNGAADPGPHPEPSTVEPADAGEALARVVLLDARGVAPDDLDRYLEAADDLNDVVVVIDVPDFTPVRRHGVRFEFMPDHDQVASRYDDVAAARVRDDRWQEILDLHEPREIRQVTG